VGDEAAQALRNSEVERAAEVLARKFPQAPATAAERARQARFLAGRGFAADVIARLIRRRENHRRDADGDDSCV